MHSCGRKMEQPLWWNDEVGKAWAGKILALAKWQNGRKAHLAQPELLVLLRPPRMRK